MLIHEKLPYSIQCATSVSGKSREVEWGRTETAEQGYKSRGDRIAAGRQSR